MGNLNETTLLAVWEQGYQKHLLDKGLLVLAAAEPDLDWHDIVAMPIGQRDRHLLTLRTDLFGNDLQMQVACPECEEGLQFDATVDELTFDQDLAAGALYTTEFDGTKIQFRVPDTSDLGAALAHSDLNEARAALANLCLDPAQANALTPDQIDHLAECLSEIDAQSAISFALQCPNCDHNWSPLFDVVSYLWKEIDFTVRAILDDVLEIAAHFGWKESEILQLPPARRAYYLKRAAR